jgi:hypothetical protein
LETRPRDHTFTSGHTPNKYNIIEPIDAIINMQLKQLSNGKHTIIMRRARKHSSKFVCTQTRLSHTITVNALDGSNKHHIHRDINQKDTHDAHTSHLYTMIRGIPGEYNN